MVAKTNGYYYPREFLRFINILDDKIIGAKWVARSSGKHLIQKIKMNLRVYSILFKKKITTVLLFVHIFMYSYDFNFIG